MKIRYSSLLVIGIFLIAITISPVYASLSDSLLIQVSDEIRKIYYNEKNITSVLFVPDSMSVIFETGNGTILEMKIPQIYKKGPGLFVLQNGEEIDPNITFDNCFYYAIIETHVSGKIEIIFTQWAEYQEILEGCESIDASPLLQTKLGVNPEKI